MEHTSLINMLFQKKIILYGAGDYGRRMLLLLKEIEFFLNADAYVYEKIIVNIGGQHGHHKLCCSSAEYRGMFKQSYVELVDYLFEYCKDIILVSFTPNNKKEELRNKEILERNNVLKEVADTYSIKYIDIYNFLNSENYEYTDMIHFEKDAYVDIAKIIAEYIRNGNTVIE